jgi:hypothetical protein
MAAIDDIPESSGFSGSFLTGPAGFSVAGSRTQIFLGNRLEDILRLDLTYGIGVRQELPDDSILAVSLVATSLDRSAWSGADGF